MLTVLLIAGIVLLYSFQTLFCKLYTDRYPGRPELASPVFGVLEGAAILIVTLAFNGFAFHASLSTVVLGVLNAAVLFGYNTSLIAAGKRGSYAFMNVLMLFGGILVPMIYSSVKLGETPTAVQFLAILAMLVSFVLMNFEDIRLKNTPPVYYVLCGALFLFNGLYGTLLKMQSAYHGDESGEMVAITFGLMGVIALVQLAVKEKGKTFEAFRFDKRCVPPLIVCLASAALAVNGLVYVLPLIPAPVLYTVENGGVLLLSALYSVFLFREKTSAVKWAGIALAAASITALSIA